MLGHQSFTTGVSLNGNLSDGFDSILVSDDEHCLHSRDLIFGRRS